jgi:hypothetical protein
MCDRELRQHIDGTFSALFTLLALDNLRFGGSYHLPRLGPTDYIRAGLSQRAVEPKR